MARPQQTLKQLFDRAARRLGLDRKTVTEYVALQRSQLAIDAKLAPAAGRVGLVGCGRQGRAIAGAVKKLPGWSVTDACDVRADAAASLNDLWPDARPHTSIDALLAHELDVVVIATTAASHFALTRAAIERGARAILVEKPLTNRLADADQLVELAARRDCTIAVNHTRRYMLAGAIPGLKRLLQSNVVGAPRSAYFLHGRAGFANMGSHLFDVARWLFDSDIATLRADLDASVDPDPRARASTDATGRCEARLANGVRIHVDLSGDLGLRQQSFVIACEDGRIEVDERLGTLRLVGNGLRVWESGYAFRGQLDAGVGRALVELANGKPPRCSLADGRAAIEAAIACHVSSRRQGAWVELPLTGAVREETFEFV